MSTETVTQTAETIDTTALLPGEASVLQAPGRITMTALAKCWRRVNQKLDERIGQLHANNTPSSDIDAVLRNEFGRCHHWTNLLVKPLAIAWEQAGWFDRCEVMGPFGLGAHVSIHCYRHRDDENPQGMITFAPALDKVGEPVNENDPVMIRLVDRSRDLGRFAPGTLGAVNGLNNPEMPIEARVRCDDWHYWSRRIRYV